MASMAHVFVGLAAGRAHAGRGASKARLAKAMAGYVFLSLLPDGDCMAFYYGIPYGAPFGHRGASHSILVGIAVGVLAAAVLRLAGERFWRTALIASIVVVSHGVLDAFTDGGRGIALLWPFTTERYFMPWRPIPVAPIGVDFLSARGLYCLAVETVAFSPLLAFAIWPRRRALAVAAPPRSA